MTDHNRSPEESDDEQYYQYHLDRNGSPLADERSDEVVNKNFIKPDVSGELVCSYKTCNEKVWLYGLCTNHLLAEWS